jgi:hypothetical protein
MALEAAFGRLSFSFFPISALRANVRVDPQAL